MAGTVTQLRTDEGGSSGKRVPPHSIEAEEGVLGAILLQPMCIDAAFEIAGPEAFYRSAHRKIAARMLELHEAGDVLDVLTLSNALKSHGELEDVGGAAGLAELSERVPTSANVLPYARIVREHYFRRQLIAETAQFGKDLFTRGALGEYAPARVSALTDLAATADSRQEKFQDSVTRAAAQVVERMEGASEPALRTGLDDLDASISGIRLGHLIVIGGLSSHGKTSLATQMLEGPLRAGAGVGVGMISADTSKTEMLQRIAGQRSGVSTRKIADGRLSSDEHKLVNDAWEELHDQPLQIVDDKYDWTDVKISIRRMINYGAKIILIDHLTLLTNHQGGRDYHERIGGIVRDLQQLTRQGIAVMLLVQINIRAEDRKRKNWRPTGALLKGGGGSYENAHEVLIVHWPGRDNPDPSTIVEGCDEYHVYVDKQKMGDVGRVKLRWRPQTMRLHDWFERDLFGGPAT